MVSLLQRMSLRETVARCERLEGWDTGSANDIIVRFTMDLPRRRYRCCAMDDTRRYGCPKML